MSVLFNMLSRFIIAFLSRSKQLLISWPQSLSAVIWEPKKIKSVIASTLSLSICHDVMVLILVFECWVLSQPFHSLFSPSLKGLLVPLHFLPLEWYHLPIWSWRFLLAILIPARWRSGKEFVGQCRRLRRRGFDPWVRKILWNRKSQPTPVFLPGKFHGQRSLVGYSPWGCKESDLTEQVQGCE